jgi:hypothetical protein
MHIYSCRTKKAAERTVKLSFSSFECAYFEDFFKKYAWLCAYFEAFPQKYVF